MEQVSDKLKLGLLEQRISRQIASLEASVETRLQVLEAPAAGSTAFTSSPNYIANSHPEWSKSAYTTGGILAATVNDVNRECYNWYQQAAATTALSIATTPLVGTGHTTYAGLAVDKPVWDVVNGTFKVGGSTTLYDIACPLETDFIFPGQRYYIYVEVSLASTSIVPSDGLQFYCGFWDNTGGQQKWIEGGNFTPTASVFGVAGTRTLEYKILAETDSGTQILSNTITVTTAPAILTAANHVRLSFNGAPGFIYYGIYRKDGAVYRLVHEIRNSIDLQFFDIQETVGAIVAAFPTVTTQRPQAYAKTAEFTPGELSSTAFTVHTLTIQVPLTYDRSLTTNGNQWFRFGLDALMPASSERGIVIRRIAVSEGYGNWTRSNLDLAALSSPTSTAASAPTTGNPSPTPAPPGTGFPNCVTLDTEISVLQIREVDGKEREFVVSKDADDVSPGEMVVVGPVAIKVKSTGIGWVAFVYKVETKNGKVLECSESHRLVRSLTDKIGRAVKHLNVGDLVLTAVNGEFQQSEIISKAEIIGQRMVKSFSLPSPHLFITNGFVSHNRKALDEPE